MWGPVIPLESAYCSTISIKKSHFPTSTLMYWNINLDSLKFWFTKALAMSKGVLNSLNWRLTTFHKRMCNGNVSMIQSERNLSRMMCLLKRELFNKIWIICLANSLHCSWWLASRFSWSMLDSVSLLLSTFCLQLSIVFCWPSNSIRFPTELSYSFY